MGLSDDCVLNAVAESWMRFLYQGMAVVKWKWLMFCFSWLINIEMRNEFQEGFFFGRNLACQVFGRVEKQKQVYLGMC